MRRSVVILLFFCLGIGLSAQSVTISQEQLDELILILQEYAQIPPKLDQLGLKLETLQSSLDGRTSDLQTGFDQYKKVVDTELIPRLQRDEQRLEVMDWTTWIAIGAGTGAAIGSFGGKPIDSALGALIGAAGGAAWKFVKDRLFRSGS